MTVIIKILVIITTMIIMIMIITITIAIAVMVYRRSSTHNHDGHGNTTDNQSKPRTVWDNVVLSDGHNLEWGPYIPNAQNKPGWEGADLHHMHLMPVG